MERVDNTLLAVMDEKLHNLVQVAMTPTPSRDHGMTADDLQMRVDRLQLILLRTPITTFEEIHKHISRLSTKVASVPSVHSNKGSESV